LTSFKFARILPGVSPDFFCDHEDLDPHFQSGRAFYEAELSTITYALTANNGNDLIAMVGLSNAYLDLQGIASGPAVKIDALGVSNAFKGQGIGVHLIQFLQAFFVIENKTGCRYMTVDSYNNPRTLNFYKKHCEFIEFLPAKKTTSMFYDLAKTRDSFEENPTTRNKYHKIIRKIAEAGWGMLEIPDRNSSSSISEKEPA